MAAGAFPMPMDAFLKGGYLNRADVLLMRGHRLFSKAIRYATSSVFSHAALVFLVPEPEQGFDHTFILEAVPAGVDVTRLEHDTSPKPDGSFPAAISVVRLAAPWFSDDIARVVRGHMLNFIEAGYDWQTVLSIAANVLATRLSGKPEEVPKAFAKSLKKAQANRQLAPANFVCSGFVQYGYLRALADLAADSSSGLGDAEVRSVVFNPRLAGVAVNDALGGDKDAFATLMSTTPEEISRSPVLQWKYVLLKGQAHAVASRDEAVALMKQAP